MARIDSILSIVVQQGANELRLGTDRAPQMLAHGTPKKLSLPVTPDDMLRHLLGDLLSEERERTLRESGRVEVTYDARALGVFQVKMTAREGSAGALDVVILKGGSRPATAAHPSSPTPPEEPPPRAAAATPNPRVDPVGSPPARTEAFLSSLVARAFALHASDLHLHDGHVPIVRVDGSLSALNGTLVSSVEALLDSTLDAHARARLAEGLSVDKGLSVEGVGRVRLNVYRTAEGIAAAIRLLAQDAPALRTLHLPVPLDDLVDLPHGLVVLCGPTGSGKSSTLAALAQEALRRRSIALLTLEDPIEYALTAGPNSIVRQRQVGRDVRDFASGLRDALREDPDVLLIGEMRDTESISLALTAAETGHLVLTSLHSRSASSAVERIVDSYPPERQGQIRVQLADSLRAVVSQRLLPRTRGGGRIPAVEVLRGTPAVASLVREGKTPQIPSAVQAGKRDGMLSLERCLADLVASGQVAIEAARAVANDPATLALYLAQ